MKRIISLGLLLVMLFSSFGAAYAETGIMQFGEWMDFELQVDHPEYGLVTYAMPVLTIGGRMAWCVDMYTFTEDQALYYTVERFSDIPAEIVLDLELIVHAAWTLSPQTSEDFFVTTLILWEKMGYPISPTFAGTTKPNPSGLVRYDYPTRKAEVLAMVEQYKRMSSLQGQEISLKVGETLVLEDTNGVLATLLRQSGTLNHTELVWSGNQLTITGRSPGTDHYVFDRFDDAHLGTTLFWKNDDGLQNVATFEISNPLRTEFSVRVVEPTGSLLIKKEGAGGEALSGVGFRLLDEAGGEVARGVSDSAGELTFSGLAYGNYQLIEDSAAPGYVPNLQPIAVTIDREEVVVIELTNEPTTVEFLKVDREGNPLAGATLELWDEAGQLLDEWLSTTEAKRWYGLEPGGYQVREVAAPMGYRPAEPIDFLVELIAKTQRFELINQPGLGEIKISKIDISTGEPIPGSRITLYQADGTEIDSQVTDESGLAEFSALEVGAYYFIESEAPEGYVLNEAEHHFEITEHGQILRAQLPNQLIMGTPIIKKIDFSTEEPLPNTIIELYSEAGELLQTQTTDEFGEAAFDPVPYGRYYFLEKEAPEGYILNPYKHWFEIRYDGQIHRSIMSDQLLYAKPAIHKLSQETGERLPGVTFELYNIEGELLETQTTDEAGRAEFSEVPYGLYYFKEVATIEGYVLSDEEHWFDIHEDREIVVTTITNRMIYGVPELSKTDISTAEPIPDTLIELYSEAGEFIEAKRTDEAGLAVFEPLAYGRYYFLEKEAPEGYVLNPDKHWFEIRLDGETVRSTMTNRLIQSKPVLTKLDLSTSEPIPDTVIELYNEANQLIETKTTDLNGVAEFSPVSYGRYYFLEKAAPEGYLLNTDKHWFEVNTDGEIIRSIMNNEQITGQLRIKKVASDSQAPLAGAVFSLYRGDDLIERYTTDEAGLIELELVYGRYRVVETKAPSGYQATEKEFEIEIDQPERSIELVVENTKLPQALPSTGAGGAFLALPGLMILGGWWLRRKRR
ncbi:MAG TPA: hypothetical protein GXZ74_03610 [Tissierellia bacterium]|nr:hypothetical protein [Tissierellia bacterium]